MEDVNAAVISSAPRARGPSHPAAALVRGGRIQPTQRGRETPQAVLHINLVVVSTSSYWLCWWLVLALHAITAVFVLCAAFVHLALSLPAIHANTPALQLSIPLKRVAGGSYLVVALLHVRAVMELVFHSVRARELVLRARPTPMEPRLKSPTRVSTVINHYSGLRRMRKMYDWIYHLGVTVFGADGCFGINGPFFNISVLFRELVEIFMQSYQLWSLSHAVSRVWINDFAVAAVVLNCFSIPLVHSLFRRRERTRRMMLLVVDMYLDFACAVVVPVCVMLPYLLDFQWKTRSFPQAVLADDIWLANAVAEGRQVLVTSYIDLLASLLPQYSIYSCLRILKRMITRRSNDAPSHSSFATVAQLRSAPSELTKASHARERQRERRGVRLVSVALGLWGMVVFSMHVHAKVSSGNDRFPGCILHLRPWLAKRTACAVVTIHCHRLAMDGNAQQATMVLDQLERAVLTRIVFAHCPALVIPSIVREFYQLTGMLVYNCTVVAWASDAAITQSHHPMFGSIQFFASDVSEIPRGLYHSELPLALFTLTFSNCSLARIPDDIGDVWGSSSLERMRLENTRLRAIPLSFGKLPIQLLSITDSPIQELPDDLLTTMRLTSLKLSGNPLSKLPSQGSDLASLRELLVEHTNVARVPEWVISWLKTRSDSIDSIAVSFYGSSPVCDQPSGETGSVSRLCAKDLGALMGVGRISHIKDRYPI